MTDNSIKLGNYCRKFKDLSKGDVFVLGKAFSIQVNKDTTRENNMLEILKIKPELADDREKYFYFSIQKQLDGQIMHGQVLESTITNTEDFPERSSHGARCQIDKIILEIAKSKLLPDDKNKNPEPGNVDLNQQIPVTQIPVTQIPVTQIPFEQVPFPQVNVLNQPKIGVGNKTDSVLSVLINGQVALQQTNRLLLNRAPHPKFNHCNIKLKYDESRGIEQFLSLVESFCEANDITIDAVKVKLALAALCASEHGLVLKESLVGEETQVWDLFKNKLIAILGRDHEFYFNMFKNFKRGSISPGLALARISSYYRKSFPITRENLNTDDKNRIFRAFVESLEQPVQGMIKAEEYRLNLDNVAIRVQQLERAYFLKQNQTVSV